MMPTPKPTIRHAWLQKHPTPLASRGEFHWYPEAAGAGDRELRASFVERLRGIEPPAVLWQLEPGRAAWGQAFSATAPLDNRRYVGLVLSVVDGERPVSELLAHVAPPAAAPWSGADVSEAGRAPGLVDVARLPRTVMGDVTGAIRALLTGGAASVDDPTSAELPRWIASIDRTLPDGGDVRTGVFSASAGETSRRDRVAELAAAAWREPGSPAAEAWVLLRELAEARNESVDQVGAALEADPAAVLTSGERAELGRANSVVDVLHAWGRGRFDRSPAAASLPARLADLVALRAVARLAAGGGADEAIAEARWYALLSARRRTALLTAVAERTQSLRTLVEGHHA